MALPSYAIETDAGLETAARDKTSYDSSNDQLPGSATAGQMFGIMKDAKRVLHMRTGSDEWYTDLAYGQALVALTAMKMKEAVENVNISRYGIGGEQISFSNADPDDSQQIISWSDELNSAIQESELDFDDSRPTLKNTAGYIG